MKEFKRCQGTTANVSATLKALDVKSTQFLTSHCDVVTNEATKVSTFTLRNDVKSEDFKSLFVVTQIGDTAIVVYEFENCLNDNFSLQTVNKDKGSLALSATAHNSLEKQGTVPVIIHRKELTTTPPPVEEN